MSTPFFSVLVTAYNRAEEVERCVNSCIGQTFEDFEVVVVDDASTDGTTARLCALDEPRLRTVRHEQNRGISPARATAVSHACGEWFVIMDSDWELLPDSLARLRTLIDGLPTGVRIIRSRLQWDDGRISPSIIPSGVTDYRGRLLWHETIVRDKISPTDAGHCIHRTVFDTTNYFEARRGAMETLWELDLARRERSLWVPDVLGLEHSDAQNSHSRESRPTVIPRLLAEAPDSLWMAETVLAEHEEGLIRYAPRLRAWILESAARQAFLAGHRLKGIRYSWFAARAGGASPKFFATVIVGMLGPRALAHAKATGRKLRASKQRRVRAGVVR